MDIILNVLNQTLVFTIPLLVVALGGMFSERSGVVNIALEGIMIGGAFVGVYFIYLMQLANTSLNPLDIYYRILIYKMIQLNQFYYLWNKQEYLCLNI